MAVKISLFLVFFSASAMATNGWQDCMDIASGAERLACYDNYARSLSENTQPADTASQKAAFGLPKTSPAKDLQNISSSIHKIEKTAHGKRILYLDNQQIWKQLGSGSQPVLKPGDMITIERGALGSYILKKIGNNRSLRVKRLK